MILDTAHVDEEDKQCALIQAARKGDFEMIHLRLEHGTDIECSLINCKPLLLSITPWAEVTARLLVISRADTNAQVSGQISLIKALYQGHRRESVEFVRFLLDHGANPYLKATAAPAGYNLPLIFCNILEHAREGCTTTYRLRSRHSRLG